MEFSPQAITVYLKLYPNLSLEEIRNEIKEFELVLKNSSNISENSSNYYKYLRGWLLKVNELKK